MSQNTDSVNILINRLALLTVIATFLLLMLGGTVSSKGVGMAVPDWPTTFGENMFTYPLSKMVGGVFYEHSHRLLGSLVGFLTISLTTLILFKEERRWLKYLSIIALFAVIAQGVMGGLRVVEISKSWAVAHGAFAHAFFGLIVSIAIFLSDFWKKGTAIISGEGVNNIRMICLTGSVAIYLQLIFGAIYRHTGNLLWVHLIFAIVVAVISFLMADAVGKKSTDIKLLKRASTLLVILLIVQLTTGLTAFMTKLISPDPITAPPITVLLTLTHVLIGSSLFVTSVSITLGVFRYSEKLNGEIAL